MKKFFKALWQAILEAHDRQIQREIADFLRTHAWSDETERELSRRWGSY